MAKTLGKDPTANLFALLADESVSTDNANASSKGGTSASDQKDNKKKTTNKKDTTTTTAAPAPTPYAIAQARKAAAKAEEKKVAEVAVVQSAVIPGGSLVDIGASLDDGDSDQFAPSSTATDEKNKAPPKMNRSQWEQQKSRRKNNKETSEVEDTQVGNTGGQYVGPPRFQGQGQGGERGGRGGARRGGRRGGRGGRGGDRGGDRGGERPAYLDENKNRDYNYRGVNLSEGRQAPRGRDYDRKSGMKTGRVAGPKKGGASGSTWTPAGTEVENSVGPVVDTTGQVGWGDEAESFAPPSIDNNAAEWGDILPAAPAEGAETTDQAEQGEIGSSATAPVEPPTKGLTEHLKERENEIAKLNALLKTVQTRKPGEGEEETSLSAAGRFVEPEKIVDTPPAVDKAEKPETTEDKKKKKVKLVPTQDYIKFIVPGGSRRGRGGRGRGGEDGEGRYGGGRRGGDRGGDRGAVGEEGEGRNYNNEGRSYNYSGEGRNYNNEGSKYNNEGRNYGEGRGEGRGYAGGEGGGQGREGGRRGGRRGGRSGGRTGEAGGRDGETGGRGGEGGQGRGGSAGRFHKPKEDPFPPLQVVSVGN